jgi:hypothetical protein
MPMGTVLAKFLHEKIPWEKPKNHPLLDFWSACPFPSPSATGTPHASLDAIALLWIFPRPRFRFRAHPRTAPVAQVSKPAVSPISKSAGRCQTPPRQRFVRPAGLEASDTEGLQTGVAGGNVRIRPPLFPLSAFGRIRALPP